MDNKKAFSLFSTKSLIEEESGDFIVEGIASTPTLDSDQDSLNSLGASFRTLPFPFLLNHDHQTPVGSVIEATPTEQGIFVKIRIPKVREEGKLKRDCDYAIHSIKYNIISGLSIGFSAFQSDVSMNEAGGMNIEKYEVYELSLCALQSNSTAFITSFKNLNQSEKTIEDITKEESKVDPNPSDVPEATTEDVLDSVEDEVGDTTESDTLEDNTQPEVDVEEAHTSDIVEDKDTTEDTKSVKSNRVVKLITSNKNTNKVKLI